MRAAVALIGVGLIAACSALPDAGGGVVALELRPPDSLAGAWCTAVTSCTLLAGDTLTLRARALNLNGDSIAATITWNTPDTGLIALDALRGIVTTKTDTGGTAHVQASGGTLRSDVISIALQRLATPSPGLRAPP